MPIVDISNQKFYRLTALYPTEKRDRDRSVIWHCRCECGNEVDVSGKRLRQGNTKSCGCLNTETRAALGRANKKDLTGMVFGRQCECGAKPLIKGTSLLHGVKSCGCLLSKGEARIAELLAENNIPFEVQKSFDDCIFPDSNRKARFDFWVDNKYLIEYDGQQHFESNPSPKSWNTDANVAETQERDKFKNEWCAAKGITLIRIPYTKLKTLTIEDLREPGHPVG